MRGSRVAELVHSGLANRGRGTLGGFDRDACARLERAARSLISSGVLRIDVSIRHGEAVDLSWSHPHPAAGLVRAPRHVAALCALKPVLAASLVQIMKRCRFDLDSPVLPLVGDRYPGLDERLSARHLLHHTSGLVDEPRADGGLASAAPPGVRARYSPSTDWKVLDTLASSLLGRPFLASVQRDWLDPSGFGDIVVQRVSATAVAPTFAALDGQRLKVVRDRGDGVDRPTKGIATTVGLADLYAAAIGAPTRQLGDPAIVAEIVDGITTCESVRRGVMYDEKLKIDADYGLGTMIDLRRRGLGRFASTRSFGHSGASMGVDTIIGWADSDHDLAAAVAVVGHRNQTTAALARLTLSVYRSIGAARSGSDSGSADLAGARLTGA